MIRRCDMNMVSVVIQERLKSKVRDIPDFPKKGIIFKDITPLLNDSKTFREAVQIFAQRYDGKQIHKIVAIESRGFIFGSALAYHLGTGFAVVRKTGKLPYKTIKKSYDLEYGSDVLEIHEDGIRPGDNVVIVDDLLATGGTALATAKLVEELKGNIVECSFLIELSFLKGRQKLKNYPVFSILQYES